eukprot:1319219-Amorphochlora_amoeboformis.AAC.2
MAQVINRTTERSCVFVAPEYRRAKGYSLQRVAHTFARRYKSRIVHGRISMLTTDTQESSSWSSGNVTLDGEQRFTEETKREPQRTSSQESMSNRFEHLSLVDMLGDSERELEFNTTTGIPFENENFKGRVIFKLRPDDDLKLNQPYREYFSKYHRKFSLQIQGKFKHKPEGRVYLGGELGHPEGGDESRAGVGVRMDLGFLRSSVCRMVLGMINLMRGNIVHYNFGDGAQLPHLMMPLKMAADTFQVTPEGKIPPEQGLEIRLPFRSAVDLFVLNTQLQFGLVQLGGGRGTRHQCDELKTVLEESTAQNCSIYEAISYDK